MPASDPDELNTFGRLLRFWRRASDESQEALAHGLGVSTRHLSFLETGRARAGRPLIDDLAVHFGLGERERGNLMMAAGLLPASKVADLRHPDNHALRHGLALTLKAFDPFPAAVIDPCANIKLVNRAWVVENHRRYGERILGGEINTIRLLVSDHAHSASSGLQDLICLYLVILQQEAIMRDDADAAAMTRELIAHESVPADWALRGAKAARSAQGHNHLEIRRGQEGEERVFLNIHHTVGASPYVAEPRLIIHTIVPEDGVPTFTMGHLGRRFALSHPLLAY